MRRRDHDRIVTELSARIRYLERQNDQLLDRLMYATDKTWMPPPLQETEEVETVEPYSFTPEQFIDATPVE